MNIHRSRNWLHLPGLPARLFKLCPGRETSTALSHPAGAEHAGPTAKTNLMAAVVTAPNLRPDFMAFPRSPMPQLDDATAPMVVNRHIATGASTKERARQ